MAPVEPHLLQPGAVNEDGSTLKFRHVDAANEKGDVEVSDVFSAQRGTYAIVTHSDGGLSLVHLSTLAENYQPVSEPNEDQKENERLRQELAKRDEADKETKRGGK